MRLKPWKHGGRIADDLNQSENIAAKTRALP
jgi:hypothetical protein